MSINENNIIEVDDSTLLENTPMMVIEQGGKTLAIPVMQNGGGGVEQVQADWTQADDTAPDFIKNKPEIPESQEIKFDTISEWKTITIVKANTRYVFTKPLHYLVIESVEDSNYESEIDFSLVAAEDSDDGTNEMVVHLPETLKIVGLVEFSAGKHYLINIKNSIAVVVNYE